MVSFKLIYLKLYSCFLIHKSSVIFFVYYYSKKEELNNPIKACFSNKKYICTLTIQTHPTQIANCIFFY